MVERQHPDEEDVDAAFASIIARWDDELPPEQTPAHELDPGAAEPPHRHDAPHTDDAPHADAPHHDAPHRPTDAPPPGDRPHHQSTADVHDALPRREPPATADEVPWRVDPTHSVADALLGADDDPGTADEGEGFTPPPPAPLPPGTDRLFWGALGGLVLGPLLLVWLVVARPSVGGWATALAIALTVGGFACLVLRQPGDRDDDPTNGARV